MNYFMTEATIDFEDEMARQDDLRFSQHDVTVSYHNRQLPIENRCRGDVGVI